MISPTVILDACVLYPAALRSLFMYLAVNETIHARWTERIHEEWMTAVLRERQDLSRAQLERTRDLMNRHALDAVVTDYERHIPALVLPDLNDRHVLAAAIECGAEFIITWNLKDFPKQILNEYGIEAVTPDLFLTRLMESEPTAVLKAMRMQHESLKNPALTAEEYLEMLNRQGLHLKWTTKD
ncbi:PIN domain-containing protein [Prosthecobacter fusiformis]|uniref:PIN domain-containing protein n=1 Tax=Prosthecobacter fusiformis TaxID=48464 RepID=A0A4R7RNS2_9BACT|nr:PIN domain-containing protein [Prosthecobacter fusiformis]TDU66458.1 PIN domain-containing protein [Prosthecobacter fusiformis]